MFRRPLKKQVRRPERIEIGGFPAFGYSIDRGLGLGVLFNIARFSPGYYPYRWRLRFQAQVTTRLDAAGGLEFPYQSHYVLLDLPQVREGMRLQIRAEFRRFSTAGYFGLGNASPAQEPWLAIDPGKLPEAYRAARRFQQYDRIYPLLSLAARSLLWRREKQRLEVFFSGELTYNWITAYPGSRLEEDVCESLKDTTRGRVLRGLLKGLAPHLLLLLGVGLLWDTRDHELNPTHGAFHEISVRGSPGVDARLAFAGSYATMRWYHALLGRYLVLAWRLMADVLWGTVPFYLLAEHGGFSSSGTLGSGDGLRAMPLGRIHGKIKVLGSIELRSSFWAFRLFGLRMWLGAAIFCDVGRAWLDVSPEASLFDRAVGVDPWWGWKVAGGGGLRLQWGEAIMVRLDLGYSNTGDFGFYLGTGHAF
ncbi:MAG: BamA/TamA family outer membrane protein [Myxococcales bacterium]|nr:BamA/TamA family outer membrane protein [Myxococcales bacterium]